MNERKKAFSTNWFFEGDLEEQQKLLKGRKNRTSKHKKKSKSMKQLCVFHILAISVVISTWDKFDICIG